MPAAGEVLNHRSAVSRDTLIDPNPQGDRWVRSTLCNTGLVTDTPVERQQDILTVNGRDIKSNRLLWLAQTVVCLPEKYAGVLDSFVFRLCCLPRDLVYGAIRACPA
jgi:hypothetical protein